MTADKLEFLNSFFSQRLLAAAGEIFQVVKDTITEYQQEINRINQENQSLKIRLRERSGNNEADDQSSQAVPMDVPNYSQEHLDTKPSIINVKVELSTTLHPDAESQDPSQDPSNDPPSSSSCSPYPESVDCTIICKDEAPEIKHEIVENYHHLKGQSTSSQCLISPAEILSQTQAVEPVVYCEFCGKPFDTREQLKQHLVIHRDERPRPYRCDLCDKSYSYAQVLETHRRTHTGERPYDCRFCGRRFNQKCHLKYHEKIHTGEKPHSCSLCGKRFIQKSQMKRHTCNPYETAFRQSGKPPSCK
ncbi:zinc finger protein 3-like [Astyanax mexicanus]|uniref:Zinc finger protein 3-like n=1 Tax=Astyanax mexicanus TaxID=7994 RepID=A0A8T2KU40_ASTMX|nr:zinc finger protein 3-like [Astyanax mexicanus]